MTTKDEYSKSLSRAAILQGRLVRIGAYEAKTNEKAAKQSYLLTRIFILLQSEKVKLKRMQSAIQDVNFN